MPDVLIQFIPDANGEDHFSSKIGVGGLLNADKINLVGIVLDNMEIFHRHRYDSNYNKKSSPIIHYVFYILRDNKEFRFADGPSNSDKNFWSPVTGLL